MAENSENGFMAGEANEQGGRKVLAIKVNPKSQIF